MDTLVYLEDLLKNAEKNSFGSDRANLRHWLAQIKALAFDIEDMVDEYYSSKEQFEESSSYAKKGSLFCSLSNPIISKVSMVHKMKSKRELLQTRQHLPTQYHFISHINSVVDFYEKQTTSYRNSDVTIFGRDRDLGILIDMIMQKSVNEISIISIVGPVGLGKTSLAQLVFNDSRTKAFRFRIWVHVSMGNVSLEKIGRDIILQTTERFEGNMQLQSIKNAVQTILSKYSCLIVLDSLWGKGEEVNELKQMLLTGGHTESKIIVTTHSDKVANLISTTPPYNLSALSEDDCLKIFSQRAMTALNLSSCPDLKIIGSFESLTSLQILNLSNCPSLERLPLCLKKLQHLDVSGCQDCIVQFCSESSGSSPSHQLSEQDDQVILSCDISETISEEPAAVGDLKGKKKLTSHVDKEPEVVTKPNENGDIVQGIPGQRSLLSSSYSYSLASSSSAPLASVSSSDISKLEHPVSNGEKTGNQPNEKCQEPGGFIEDVLITEESMCSSDTRIHLHEGATKGAAMATT
uniref:Uncharacterized protein n=1 Tax=Avena sativa TaxID=4498 RepID=A0ACD5XQW2_AVESA